MSESPFPNRYLTHILNEADCHRSNTVQRPSHGHAKLVWRHSLRFIRWVSKMPSLSLLNPDEEKADSVD